MTSDELIATLSKVRGEIAGKSRAYTSTLKGLAEVLKALKDPSKNAAALNEGVRKLRKEREAVLSFTELGQAFEKIEQIAKKELDNSAFTFKRDLQAAFEERNITLDTRGGIASSPILCSGLPRLPVMISAVGICSS